MNYYEPRQMKTADGTPGLWHYTCMNDGRTWPTGNCAQGCPGHESADEACEHQALYDADHCDFDSFSFSDSDNHRSEYKCSFPGCENWTKRFARIIGGTDYTLCDLHRNREGLLKVHRPGVIVSSY